VIILDTQHISQLQLIGTTSESRLKSRLETIPDDEIWITIISPYEQLGACLGHVNAKSNRPDKQVREFEWFGRLLNYYSTWRGRILPFDQAAAGVMSHFTPHLIRRIGARDCRIAAIALANRATLLSANLRDFQQVPGLQVEDWLRV
jgi:predicted nucleic acid-binding protein